jgi:hypothetical protein
MIEGTPFSSPRRLLIHMRAVGGQALPLMVNLLARRLSSRATRIDACETHGMAQRGGIVAATLDVELRDAAADAPMRSVLLGFEVCEGIRALPLLRSGDAAFVSRALIAPPGNVRRRTVEVPDPAQVERAAAALGIQVVWVENPVESPWAVVEAAMQRGAIPS